MIDFSAVHASLRELRSRLEQLETQFAELEAATTAQARRVGFETEPGEQGVIPPTRTAEGAQPIMGGEETSDFPDCCAVGDSNSFFCTGTLIAPTVVVTARHCVGSTRVFFGTNVDDPQTGQVIKVSQQFSKEDADIQVLVLERSPDGIEPRHIAQGSEVTGGTCILIGFGNTEATGRFGYGKKRKVENIPIASLDCSGPNDGSRFGCRSGIELVAGQRGLRKDSCTGDSGGPLYIKRNGSIFLMGATSRGVRSENVCGDGGIYMRVDQFIDWIKQKTGANIPGPEL